jgi:ParB-like chromosome segregation protein Spo0J
MKISINKIKPNINNPRFIKDYKFKKLVDSIKEFPEMLEKRPIVVDEDMIVLGGNMRLKACQEAGLKEVDILIAQGWTEEQKREFIIKDNVGFGEWDWDILANDWDNLLLEKWGLDGVKFDWDNLDYIEEAEKKDVAEDKIVIALGNANKIKSEITENLNKWLQKNYPECEIK